MKKLLAIVAFAYFSITSAFAQTFTNYTDIWWNANESGWGLQVNQHNNEIFAVWYTYDTDGSQLFIIMSGCDLQAFNGTTCRGNLYRTTGSPFNTVFNKAQTVVTKIGDGTLTFNAYNSATFTYRIGVSPVITKAMTRFSFATRKSDYPRDNTDIYFQNGSDGWGVSVAQNGDALFKVIYHYDEVGKPMFVIGAPTLGANNSATGTLSRSRSNGGSHYLSTTWRASDITIFPVGDTTVSFAYGGFTSRFTVNGFAQTRTLERLPFGNALPVASAVGQRCVSPRANPKYGDRPGTLDQEKSFVRSFVDETYLWYSEVPSVNIASYTSPQSLFDVLKTNSRTSSGRLKDEFHFYDDTAAYEASFIAGIDAGYGANWALLSASPPRVIVLAYTEPNSPATNVGLARGAQVLTVDGVDVANGNNVNVLNEGLFPSTTGATHTFVVRDQGAVNTRVVTMTSASVTTSPVQNTKVIDTGNGRVGYMQFNSFNFPSEGALVNAFRQLTTGGVNDLVLDMRYNGGGLLYISSQLAYMITGAAQTSGKIFEKETYSDKRVADNTDPDYVSPFYGISSGFDNTNTVANAALPSLGLSRVYVLTSGGTASASEAAINALEGIGVRVIRVGSTTRGKPYGFVPVDNCGTTYFSVEFKGANQLGFGDYADGFAPTCAVADDYTRQLGDPAEARLAAALSYRATGVCPAPSVANSVTKSAFAGEPTFIKKFWQENRITLPKAMQGAGFR